ncbi:MAG: hypothetical protein HYZ34_07140 [Ignavibacteriae bacterium]|nr:hypothetical protein [Ignavibacteriota bacterium]
MVQQTKIDFDKSQIHFINKYQELGFKDKSSLVRTAIEEYIKSIQKNELVQSAKLYAEIYQEDTELQELTNSSMEDLPK